MIAWSSYSLVGANKDLFSELLRMTERTTEERARLLEDEEMEERLERRDEIRNVVAGLLFVVVLTVFIIFLVTILSVVFSIIFPPAPTPPSPEH